MLQRHGAFEAQFGRGPLKSGNGDRVIERVVQPAQLSGLRRDEQIGSDQPQVVTLARAEHHAMFAQADGLPVTVNGGVVNREKRHQSAVPGISSVQTLKLSRKLGPNVVAIATSDASRPRAMRTRLMRGTLLRGSKMCQRPPIQASNHAAKSPEGKEVAFRHRPDSRCNIAPEYSCSGRRRWRDARSRGKRRSAH